MKPVIVDSIPKQEKVLLVDRKGQPLIVERPRPIGFRLEKR